MQFTYGGLDADLLAWWTFDVDSGQTSHDLTDNNRDMTVSGAQWTASGRRGGAYQFNGSSNDFLFDDDAENYINGLDAFTFAAWIKADQLGGDRGIYSFRWPNTNDEYGFRHDAQLQNQSNQSNGYRTGVRATGGTQHWESPPNAESTEWVHVAMTWASGQNIEVYFNGFLQTPGWIGATVTGTIRSTDRLLLGRGPRDSGGSWSGLLDDVRIYGDALSQTEVMSIVDPRPLAVNDSYEAIIDRTLTVTGSGVLLNDFDPDPGPAAITADLVSDVDHGTLALNADGSFVYTPTPGYEGPDSFTYRAYDGEKYGTPATVSLSVVQKVRILSTDVVDSTHVELLFSAVLDQTVAETPGNYVFDGGLSVTSATLAGDLRTVQLVLSDSMTDGQTYTLSISNVEDLLGDAITPNTQVQLVYSPIGDGFILWEYWNGIGGGLAGLLNNPNYPNSPTDWDLLTIFEAPTNWNDGYGTRMRGYIFPPDTGNYTFWIASDDASQLFLSTNESPANAVKIAEVTGWTPSRQWFNNASQKSVEIPLVAGQKYYIEAIHIEGGGGDNLSVAWELPDGTFEGPVPGIRLSPFVSSNDITPPSTPGAVTATAASSTQVDVAWTASFDGETGIDHYVIYRDGAVLGVTPDETTLQYSDTTADQTQTYVYSAAAINGDGLQGASGAADLVSPPPSLASVVASSDTEVVVVFGEPVMQTAAELAGNYTINFGVAGSIAISSAQWDAGSPDMVLLTLDGSLVKDVGYTLVVQNIVDATGTPVMLGESMEFGYSDVWGFDANADGFTYADDTFNNTTNPNQAEGTHDPAGGFAGGGLRVYLGPGAVNGGMSGGWSRHFVAPIDTTANVSLRYRMVMAPGYEPEEHGQVILEIDGVRYGGDVSDSLVHSDGSNPTTDTGWLQASFEIPVTAGLHTLTIGAYNNQATAGDEATTVFFDDVSITVAGAIPPMANIINVAPDPRTDAVDQIDIVFTEAVTGFDIGDLTLVLDGGADLLGGAQTLTTSDNVTWTLGGLTSLTGAVGAYTLTLNATGAGIENAVLTPLQTDASDVWTVDLQAPTVDIAGVTPDPRQDAVQSIDIVFDEPVTGLEVSDLVLTRDGGANILTGSETLTTTDNITWTLGGLSGLTGQAGGEGFVAFNDHIAGVATHANATSYAGNSTASGQLKDITTALGTGVTLTVTSAGIKYAGNSSPPTAETDAHDIFNGYIDFSAANGASLEIRGADHYTHAFSGLDSGGATTYNFHGTAIRGKANYTNRWTTVMLIGADGFTADHSSGIGVVTAGLADNQVAIWVGHNSAANQGFVAGWTNIDPGPDGAFTIVSQQYSGPTPGVGSGSSVGGSKGYGLAALRLEEVAANGTEGLYVLQLVADGSGVADLAGNPLSGDASDTWVIDTSGPIADIIDISPDPHNGPVDEIDIVFNEAVTGLDISDLSLAFDGGANLLSGSQTLTTGDNVTWTLSNLGSLTGDVGDYTLMLIAGGSGIEDALNHPIGDDAVEQWTVSLEPAVIVARHVFYNNSAGDNNGPSADVYDDGAIDASKRALLPGRAATLANVTSYTSGINGVMIDIENLAFDPVAGDFIFMVGPDSDWSNWTTAPEPTITVRPGAGVGGSDRVTLIWADGAIVDKWLEITVRSDGGINLEADDLFYFGNLVGEAYGDRVVGAGDRELFFSEFGQSGSNLATDFNRDGRASLVDFVIMRDCYGSELSDPPVLAGDADVNGVVDDDDYDILVSQFGMTGTGLSGDIDGDGRVSLADFAIVRSRFGDILTPHPAPAPAPAAVVFDEPIAADDGDSDTHVASPAPAPAIDMPSAPSIPEYSVSDPTPVSFGLSETTTPYSAPAGDDEPVESPDDLLVDILAESRLVIRL
ncbi:MAG: Ig-like domain-containing protein [Phycisphaerae bacterium]|nr:Ig-like domain-containing protein [Phycisphaerae bacterium]